MKYPPCNQKANAPENGWLEYDSFPFGARPFFRGELLVLGSVSPLNHHDFWDNDVFYMFYGSLVPSIVANMLEIPDS